MMEVDRSGGDDFIDCNLSRSGYGRSIVRQEGISINGCQNERRDEWIRRGLSIKLSCYSNDTYFHQQLMRRFYHRYSNSQDYYFSNHITNILTENPIPAVINWGDIQTMLDEDEYFKRFYEIHEYDNKIKLLSEYYKFHKDIPRLFSQPACKALNKYHDQKRKQDYHKIKKMLIEEAQKKNKRVAMNEDDNEIRLTDGNIQQTNEDLQDNEEEHTGSIHSSSVDLYPTSKNVLPESLIHSLYKRNGTQHDKFRFYLEQSNNTIDLLREKLAHAYKDKEKDWSAVSSFDFTNTGWQNTFEKQICEADKRINPNSVLRSSQTSLLRKERLAMKPVSLQITDEKARNIKDVNLNINLNLRVLREQVATSSEYNCYIPSTKNFFSGNNVSKDDRPSSEFKKIARIKKQQQEKTNDFKKKLRPDELRASSKDQSVESRMLRKAPSKQRKHLIDSENSLSHKKGLSIPQLPVTNLQLHTFSKLMTDMGGEYKKATVKTMKVRKSRNLENILIKYKPQHDKTLDVDSGKKEISEKRGNFTTRSRLATEKNIKPRVTASSSRGLESLGIPKSSRDKVNFKKKKLSLQNHNYQISKESSKQGFNIDAASLYQTSHFKQPKRSTSKGGKPVDPIELIKDKYNGSVSARTKMTSGESSILNNIVNNMSTRLNKHKLSLSNSIANHNTGAPKLFSLNVGSQPILSHVDLKEQKQSKSRQKRDGKSKSIKTSGGGLLSQRSGNLQGSKFTKLMQNEMKKKQESPDIGMKKSFGEPLSYRAPKDKERVTHTTDSREKNKVPYKGIKIGGHTFMLEKLQTAHGYSKSEITQTPLIKALPNASQSKIKASISASRIPSVFINSKVSK